MAIGGRSGILIVCLPGPLVHWCNAVVGAVAARAGVPIRLIDRLDEIATGANLGIHMCQYPSLSAIEAVGNGRLDAVLMVQDPEWSVACAMQDGSSVLEAIRSVSASTVANLAIGATSRSRLVFPDWRESASTTARKLVMAAGLPADPATLGAIGDVIGAGLDVETPLGEVVAHQSQRTPPPALPQGVRTLLAKVTAGAMAMAQGDSGQPIVWPTEVYLSGDRPNEHVTSIAAVTGPSRVMMYGPYLHLPPARYTVEIIIAFAGRIEDVPFLLEFYAEQTCLTRVLLEGRATGGYRGRFELVVVNPVAPIEIRLRNERGAIEGEVSLVELRFYVAAEEDNIFS